MRWRLLLTPPMSGAANMALDVVLLDRARRTGEAVFRVYTWSAPTLSLGRNQRAHGAYDLERAGALGIDIVRRPTGGRAVLHDHEVTYSVTAPADTAQPLRESYDAINRLLLDGLRRLGVAASLASPARRTPSPGLAPCFEAPDAGELVLGARKLVGSAQWREGGALLQHGSILVADDQPCIAAIANGEVPLVPPAATLREALGREPDVAEVADALFESVRLLADRGASELELDESVLRAERSARERFLDDAWTWRR